MTGQNRMMEVVMVDETKTYNKETRTKNNCFYVHIKIHRNCIEKEM